MNWISRIRGWFNQKGSDRLSYWKLGGVAAVVLGLIAFALFRRSYDTVEPRRGPIVEAVYGLGTVTPRRTFTAKLGVAGRIESISARPGDTVEKGNPLIRTDSIQFRAPFAGTVTNLFFEENEIVMPGSPIITIKTMHDHHIELLMDQESVLRIRPGLKAELSFETLRNRKIQGVVSRVYSSGGEFVVEVESDEMPEEVLPDMTADVAIEVARRENALLIPQRAVQRGQVQILRHGLRKRIPVKIGAADAEWVEILDDSLQPDDRIIVPAR
ncbi:MAG: efflux RND transporter periplasmic adaptor subunit [Leptospiraceae bacterium]|nr:efflux RND transporter periplasmic adaptor subunit [Leptospiraceae bacterium]